MPTAFSKSSTSSCFCWNAAPAHPGTRAISDEVPRLSRRTIEEFGSLRIIRDLLAPSVPMDLASVRKAMLPRRGDNRRAMTDLDIGHWLLARPHAFDEILEVQAGRVRSSDVEAFCPEAPGRVVHGVDGAGAALTPGYRIDLKADAIRKQRALAPVERHTVRPVIRGARQVVHLAGRAPTAAVIV